MAGQRPGRVHKGERRPVMVRVPEAHAAFYTEQAKRLRIPVGDFVACRIAICEGLPIPPEFFLAHPGLIMLYTEPEWPRVMAELPAEVVERIQRHLTEVADGDGSEQLAMTG